MSAPVTTPTESVQTVLPVVGEYIGVRSGYCGGKPHILGTRIKVQHVYEWVERGGMTPTEVVVTYPHLSMAAVHAALAYYWSHRDEIERDIAEGDRLVEEMK